MTPIGLRARREALGLTQGSLAELLLVQQASVSRWEGGDRAVPGWLDEKLGDLEDAFAVLLDELAEQIEHASALHNLAEVQIVTYAEDEAFWAADARAREGHWPAVLHRIAAAHAAWELRQEDEIGVELVESRNAKEPPPSRS